MERNELKFSRGCGRNGCEVENIYLLGHQEMLDAPSRVNEGLASDYSTWASRSHVEGAGAWDARNAAPNRYLIGLWAVDAWGSWGSARFYPNRFTLPALVGRERALPRELP